jgi:CheY-like chemotaxis protein
LLGALAGGRRAVSFVFVQSKIGARRSSAMAAVLLVEDVPIVRTTLSKFMERGGHVVTCCGGGDEAWSRLSNTRFDAVVTDLWMMDGDGLALIERLRSSGDGTPIIAITGGNPRSPLSNSIEAALGAGADRALLKPVTKAALLATIAECVGGEESPVERPV